MAAQPHHSIGEVLSLLQAEFSDVTISKIRFLESQGLIAPERTPSGYRKFYAVDIARLRWILTQQRDNFLPLKVIKKRLEEPGFELEVEPLVSGTAAANEPTLFAKRQKTRESVAKPVAKASPTAATRATQTKAVVEPKAEPKAAIEPDPQVTSEVEVEEPVEEVDGISATELAEDAGIDAGVVRELDRLGLIESIGRAGSAVYDSEALVVAKAAAVFGAHGLEPRHMRMFKVSAERQAGLLGQLFSARLAKGGDIMQQARADLNELVQLSEMLQRTILRRTFGESLD